MDVGAVVTCPLATTAMEQRSVLPKSRSACATAAVLAAMVLAVLDAAIVNVALPSMAHALKVSPGTSIWIITAYQLALVMALLPCAALGDSLGQRRVFAGGVALFTAASAFCAVSPSLPWLITARFFQGLGAAAIMSLGIALLRAVVPTNRFGTAVGWNALAVALSSAAGPTTGAAILSLSSWPWLFALNLPLGALVLWAASALPDVAGTGRPVDRISVALNAGSFASLVAGMELLTVHLMPAALLIGTGAVTLATLIRRELPKEAPLIPLDLLRAPSFRISVVASFCCFAGITLSLMALPFYLQHVLRLTTLMTAFYMAPWPLTVAVAAPLVGRLTDRVSTVWLCTVGGICLAAGLSATAVWNLQQSARPLVIFTVLCGLGFGLFQVPNNRNMFLTAPRGRSGAAGGMQATTRLAGQTVGGLIMTLIFSLCPGDTAPVIALWIGATLTLVAGCLSALRAGTQDAVAADKLAEGDQVNGPG